MPPSSPSLRLDALTGLRFFASAAIVYYHVQGYYGLPETNFPLQQGVMLFFVLSGFIMTYVYPELPDRKSVLRFFVARFARIWPLHLVCFVAAVFLGIGGIVPETVTDPAVAALNLLLLQAWVPTTRVSLSFNAVSWTLSAEALFYVLFPLLIWNFAHSWHWKLAVSFLCGILLSWIASTLALPPDGGPTEVTSTTLLELLPLSRLFQFVAGMCCCLAWRRFEAWAPRSPIVASTLELLVVATAIWLGMYPLQLTAIGTFFGEHFTFWLDRVNNLVLLVVILILLLASGRGAISRLLSSRVMIFLGEISFATYMVHLLVHATLIVHFNGLAALPWWMGLSLYLAVTFTLSVALFFFVEKPMRNWITGRRHATS